MTLPTHKHCPRCEQTLPASSFYTRSDSKKLQSWCKACMKEGQCAARHRKRSKEWRQKNKERHRRNNQKYLDKIRREALTQYSLKDFPQCRCCGEAEIKFLSLDHIDGGGGEDRRKRGKVGVKFYAALRREGWPEGLQTLCYNCNMAKGFWGTCPHKEKDGTSS